MDSSEIFIIQVKLLRGAPTVRSTAGNVHDIYDGNALLHGKESMVFADAGTRA